MAMNDSLWKGYRRQSARMERWLEARPWSRR